MSTISTGIVEGSTSEGSVGETSAVCCGRQPASTFGTESLCPICAQFVHTHVACLSLNSHLSRINIDTSIPRLCQRDFTRCATCHYGDPCRAHSGLFGRQPVTPRRVNSAKPRGIHHQGDNQFRLGPCTRCLRRPVDRCPCPNPVNDAVIHQLSTMPMSHDANYCSACACMWPSARLFTRHTASATQQDPQRGSCHAAISSCLR